MPYAWVLVFKNTFVSYFSLCFPLSLCPLLFFSWFKYYAFSYFSLLLLLYEISYYLLSNYRIFAAAREFLFRYISDNVSRSAYSCLTLRSIRKRVRNITLRVNKYFSNKRTRCECTPLLHPLSLVLFSFFPSLFLFFIKLAHCETDLFDIDTFHVPNMGETYCPVRK